MQFSKRLLQTRNLLVVMMLLQTLWLTGIWLTGASSNPQKLLPLIIYTVLAGLIVNCLPANFIIKLNQFKERLVQNKILLIVTLSLFFFIVGSLYAYNQRLWEFDEENNYKAAQMVAQEGAVQFFAHYIQIEWLGDRHPPLVPLLNGIAMNFLGTTLFAIRLISVLFGIGITLITYFMGCELYDQDIGVLAAILLITFPLVLRQSATAMLDIPATFFFSLAMLALLFLRRNPTYRLSLVMGLIVGAGILSKYTALLIYPVFLGYFATNIQFRHLKTHFIIVILVSGVMLALWVAYAYLSGIITAKYYVVSHPAIIGPGSGVLIDGTGWVFNSLLTRLPSAFGVYNIPILFLGGLHLMRQRTPSNLFVLVWIATITLLLILTIPDHRYFMLIFPALAITMAHGLRLFTRNVEQVIILTLLCWGGALYLFVDWFRTAQLFIP